MQAEAETAKAAVEVVEEPATREQLEQLTEKVETGESAAE